jgi:D-alanyl-D-alanine carboxypeptidase
VTPRDLRDLQDALDRARLETGAPGATVALVAGGEVLASLASGSRAPVGVEPLAPDAAFHAYSVTKTLLAAALLTLEREGRLRLSDPLEAHLPGTGVGGAVTVRHLLEHTSGLRDYGGLPAYRDDLRRDPSRPWSRGAYLRAALDGGPLFAPGGGWAYSNPGFMLLAMLLETLDGRPIKGAMRARLFAPLGLERTLVAETTADAAGLAPGWSGFWGGEALRDVRGLYHPGWVAHGLVASTAPELARLLDAVLGGRLLGLEAWRLPGAVRVPGSHPRFEEPRYGLGLMVDPVGRFGVTAGHNGGGPGYSASAFRFERVAGRALAGAAFVNHDAGHDPAHLVLARVVERFATLG